MPYVTTHDMLLDAQANHYAVPAFNVENLEMLQAVIEAAEEARSPVILQAGMKTLTFFGIHAYAAAVKHACRQASVPLALHLDHATSVQAAMQGFRLGFSSIMIDGSKLDFEGNVSLTSNIVLACQASGVPVEGELGSIGGKEDDMEGSLLYTDPQLAQEYVRRTGVSSLAIAIGTAHGVYATTPRLDVDRLAQVHKEVSVPLVLHGSSGLADDAVKDCIAHGICKVNFATELRQVYTQAMVAYLQEHPKEFDLRMYLRPAMQAVKDLCLHRIAVCSSAGRA